MVKCSKWPVGVCSWSFGFGETPVKSVHDILAAMGVGCVQLQLLPALKGDPKWLAEAKAADWRITSTMLNFEWEDYSTPAAIRRTGGITPDEHWDEALDMFTRASAMTKELGCPHILFHVGFIDHTDRAKYEKFLSRVSRLADVAAKDGVTILLETGQESGKDMLAFIEELKHPAIAVNFDPANLMSYQKDVPLNALRTLFPYIREVHANDSIASEIPDQWGVEKVIGEGNANFFRLLAELETLGFDGSISVEREFGNTAASDVALAVRRLAAFR